MKPMIYTNTAVHEAKSLGQAREKFVKLSLRRDYPVALVRENGQDFEVSFSENEVMEVKTFPDMKRVTQFLIKKFI